MHHFNFVDNMENINNHHPQTQFIIMNNGSLVFTLEKWGKTSGTNSLHLIRTSTK